MLIDRSRRRRERRRNSLRRCPAWGVSTEEGGVAPASLPLFRMWDITHPVGMSGNPVCVPLFRRCASHSHRFSIASPGDAEHKNRQSSSCSWCDSLLDASANHHQKGKIDQSTSRPLPYPRLQMCSLGLGTNQGNTDAIHEYMPLIRSLGIVSFSFPVPGLGPRTTSMSFAEISFRMISFS